MSPESMLLAAISAISSALVFVARLLWIKAEKCETDRNQFRVDIATLQHEHLEYVKMNSDALAKITINNTIALQENTHALKALTKVQT